MNGWQVAKWAPAHLNRQAIMILDSMGVDKVRTNYYSPRDLSRLTPPLFHLPRMSFSAPSRLSSPISTSSPTKPRSQTSSMSFRLLLSVSPVSSRPWL